MGFRRNYLKSNKGTRTNKKRKQKRTKKNKKRTNKKSKLNKYNSVGGGEDYINLLCLCVEQDIPDDANQIINMPSNQIINMTFEEDKCYLLKVVFFDSFFINIKINNIENNSILHFDYISEGSPIDMNTFNYNTDNKLQNYVNTNEITFAVDVFMTLNLGQLRNGTTTIFNQIGINGLNIGQIAEAYEIFPPGSPVLK